MDTPESSQDADKVEEPDISFTWRRPEEVMRAQVQKMRKRKKALNARMNVASLPAAKVRSENASEFEKAMVAAKRKNPFLIASDNKRTCRDSTNILQGTGINGGIDDQSSDCTLFKLIHNVDSSRTQQLPITNPVPQPLSSHVQDESDLPVFVPKPWIPMDWSLKSRIRFVSDRPISWSHNLKIGEEASGLTGFTRCVDTSSAVNSLDTSTNAKFHQCSLYWQQPYLPWLKLFPRTSTSRGRSTAPSSQLTPEMRKALEEGWASGLCSLLHLTRTKQCPYFYVCGNSFTVLIRAAGIAGFEDIHGMMTPTTRGIRKLLRDENVEYTMPLKKQRQNDSLEAGEEDTMDGSGGGVSRGSLNNSSSSKDDAEDESDDEDDDDDAWLLSMGIKKEDIKRINYTQARINRKAESAIDNSDASLILVEGIEVQPLYNFLVNCKSTIAQTGYLAGVPPTLLAPVAFQGATLSSLQVRENRLTTDDGHQYYGVDLVGPILPHTVHSLYAKHDGRPPNDLTSTFTIVPDTEPLVRVTCGHSKEKRRTNSAIFQAQNLSDCGLSKTVLGTFCSNEDDHVQRMDCLRYTTDSGGGYIWS